MIQNFISVILFLKILSQAYNFIPHVPMDIIRVFIIPEFVAENLKANKNQRKKIAHFIIQFCSRKLTHFTNLNSFEIENDMPPKNIPSLQTSQQKFFCLVSFALHYFLTLKNSFLEAL